MAKGLNFQTLKKQNFPVTFKDGTLILIEMPTKAIMDRLFTIQASLEALEDDTTNPEATNDLYDACAAVMSRNKAGKKITVEYLENIFDIEDIMIFFNGYTGFMSEIANSKN